MISRYDVALNGVRMADLNENLLILNVSYEGAKPQITSKQIGGRDGGIINKKYQASTSATVTFELHIYDVIERQSALQSVISWAKNGGVLTINDREGQCLSCVCSKYPGIESVRDWTSPLSITFTAYVIPYWQDLDNTVFTLFGRNPSTSVYVNGNGGDSLVSCNITSKGSLSSIRIACGGTFIDLSGFSAPSESVISIGYNDGFIYIVLNGGSLLGKRSAGSSDNLSVPSGAVSGFSISANANVTATFYVRGCWM